MGKKLDLVGQKFGHLTVLRECGRKSHILWECECDCPNKTIVIRTLGHLREKSKSEKSCGCAREYNHFYKFEDFTNQKIGGLTVIGRNRSTNSTSILWDCKKENGDIIIKTTQSLKRKLNPKSKEDYENYKECKIDTMIDRVFENWKVIERTEDYIAGEQSHKQYLCRCVCGNESKIRAGELRKGNIKRCMVCYPLRIKLKKGENLISSKINDGLINAKVRKRNEFTNESIINEIMRGYVANANLEGSTFELTRNEFINFIFKPCFYCGKSGTKRNYYLYSDGTPKWDNVLDKEWVEKGTIYYNGIDRVDNENRGYRNDGNLVTACKFCNFSKSDMPVEDFIILMNKIAKNHPRKLLDLDNNEIEQNNNLIQKGE